ncbi:MAG: hypothetical protein NVSMB29_08660 [Candidatus Dormibacteria bacterium]
MTGPRDRDDAVGPGGGAHPRAPRRPVNPSSAGQPALRTTGPLWPPHPLLDPAKGLFDASTLRGAIVARGWTVREFSAAAGVSHESVYRALRQFAVSDRTAVRIVAALESRVPSRLVDG